jgi:hypothetical protein
MKEFLELQKSVAIMNWLSLDNVASDCETLLRGLANSKSALRNAVSAILLNEDLIPLCEHYDLLDKLVILDDKQTGIRVRLHVFLPGYFDRPHNHRWSYSSLILQGGYRHYLYGEDSNLTPATDVLSLKPIMVRDEKAGSFYALDHRMIHSVVAQPYTVSLIVRGPAVKDRFVVMDRQSGRAWWQYGSADENEADKLQKRMSIPMINTTISKLSEIGVF